MEIKESLLQKITTEREIDDLIIEDQLREAGYQFYYFIDTVDINKYAFPFGLMGQDKDKRQNNSVWIITDEQITYHYLINKLGDKNRLLMFNEYTEELSSLIKKIYRLKSLGVELVDSFKEQILKFDQIQNSLKQGIALDDIIKDPKLMSELYVSYFISIALGSLWEGEQRLQNLKEKNLNFGLYNEEPFPDNLDKYKPVFENTTELTDDLLTELRNQLKIKVDELPRLMARHRKCSVYDRLFHANQKSKNDKILFLLVSSSESMYKKLPDIAKEKGKDIWVNGQIFNPVRSVQQMYLQLLLQGVEKSERKIKYDKIKAYIDIANEGKEKSSEEFEKEITNLRESYENSSLLLIDYYKKQWGKVLLDKGKLTQYNIIVEFIRRLIKIAEEKGTLEKLQSKYLEDIVFTKDFNSWLQEAILKIEQGRKEKKKDKNSFYFYAGNDNVKNLYDALPLVYFQGNPNFESIINLIARYVLNLSINEEESKGLINYIKIAFDEQFFYKTVPSEEEKIIMLITYLMLDSPDKKEGNKKALEQVEKILQSREIQQKWIPDFLYIQSWIARRHIDYSLSIEIAEQRIENDDSDPRFYHSAYLSYYNLYEQEKKEEHLNKSKEEHLNKSIEYCKKAYDLYQEKRENEKEPKVSTSIAVFSLLNGLAYLKILRYEELIKKDANDLDEANQHLIELKNIDKNYLKIAQFAHTEARLMRNIYSMDKDFKQLEEAQKAISRAKDIDPDDDDYELEKKEIENIMQKAQKSN